MVRKTGRWRIYLSLTGLLLALSWFADSASAAETTFSNVNMNTLTPAQYEKFEVTFDLSAVYDNPFDPEEVDVRAYFTTPSSTIEVVPGFYQSDSSPQWAVRYSPREAGAHSVVIQVTDSEGVGESSVYGFTASAASDSRGFMGVEGNRIIDSHGKQITLLGSNYAWTAYPNEILEAMPEYKASQMNMMRVWYTPYWGVYSPEWAPGSRWQQGVFMEFDGVGRYQLDNQARLDMVFETAEANDIYIMFTMNSFGDFFYNWAANAYNQANGGCCYWSENDTDFWTNPIAIDYQKKLLRYVFARWGYSTSLGILEYWNESDNHVNTYEHKPSWHEAVDTYWKSWDFYNHPTTTSFAWMDHVQHNQTSWEPLTTLDIVNIHYYASGSDAMDIWEANLDNALANFGNRPTFIGEYGRAGSEPINSPVTHRYFHDGLWSPLFRSGATGANLIWTIDDFEPSVSGFNVPAPYKHYYNVLAGFIQAEEYYLTDMPHVDYGLQGNDTKVGAFQNSDRALLWINDTEATYDVNEPDTVSGMSFTLPSMNNGTYHVKYINTVTGETIATSIDSAVGGNLTLNIPPFVRDIAVKAIRQGSGVADAVAPTAPSNLASAGKTDTTIDLSWIAAYDNVGITEYEVYRDDVLVASTNGVVKFTDSGLNYDTTYTYTIKAKDEAGNKSLASNAVQVTTNPLDTVPPSAPTDLRMMMKSDTAIVLAWTAATDNVGVTGYDIYRDLIWVDSVDGTTTAYADDGLTAGTSYSYTVRARDSRGNESAASNALVAATFLATDNLLLNPGFEIDDGAGDAANWVCERAWHCELDTSVKRSGLSSLKVTGNNNAWFGAYQEVPAEPNQTYTVDGYANISQNVDATVRFIVKFLDTNKSLISESHFTTLSGTTSGWEHVQTAVTSPAGTAYAQVYMYFTKLNMVLHVDDFSLTKETEELLLNPGFEQADVNNHALDWVCGHAHQCSVDSSAARSGASALKVSGSQGSWFALEQSVAGSAGHTYQFEGYVDIPTIGGTEVRFRIRFLDALGAVIATHTPAIYTASTSGYEQVSGSYTAPMNTASVQVYVYFVSLNTTLYLDDFSLKVN